MRQPDATDAVCSLPNPHVGVIEMEPVVELVLPLVEAHRVQWGTPCPHEESTGPEDARCFRNHSPWICPTHGAVITTDDVERIVGEWQ